MAVFQGGQLQYRALYAAADGNCLPAAQVFRTGGQPYGIFDAAACGTDLCNAFVAAPSA